MNPITRMRGIEEDRDGKIYPMGIAYVGAALEDAGHEVIILDNNQKCYSKEKIIDFLKDLKPDIVGLTGMTNSYIQIMHLARMVKETIDVPVILGGAMATYTSHVLLPNMDVDICVLGEGEETSIELFDKWPNYHDVTGIAYLDDNGEYVKTAPRMFQKTRDEYPYPGYDGLLDITKYWRNELSSWQTPFRFDKYMRSYKDQVKPGMKIATMITGLGCPYQCTFCTNSSIFMKTRDRSPEAVAKEAMYLKEKFGVEGIHFSDDLLIMGTKRTVEIADALKPTGLIWAGQAVGVAAAREKVVEAIADAGCIGYGIGIETASDRLLAAMKKGSRTKHYKAAFENAIKNNMGVRVQLMFGSPGESKETLQETIDWFDEVGMPPRRFNRLVPQPGSLNYDQCVEQGIITNEHDFLMYTSQAFTDYVSSKDLFNITDMTDEEYQENLIWAEETMFKNYERMVKSDPGYWTAMISHYIIKLLSIKPITNRISLLLGKLLNKNRINDGDRLIRDDEGLTYFNYYSDMMPDPNKRGWINKPLFEQRIKDIFAKEVDIPIEVDPNFSSKKSIQAESQDRV